jgi:hypothetical protein
VIEATALVLSGDLDKIESEVRYGE